MVEKRFKKAGFFLKNDRREDVIGRAVRGELVFGISEHTHPLKVGIVLFVPVEHCTVDGVLLTVDWV